MKFPKQITVVVEQEYNDTGEFLSVVDDLSDQDESRPAAIYRLVEVGEIAVERSYRPKRKRA